MLVGTTTIDLASSWSSLWGKISGPLGPFLSLFALVGAAMVVFGIVKWVLDMRKGGGGIASHKKLIFTILVGAILAGPDIVMPIFLTIVDGAANVFVGIVSSLSKGL